MKTHDIDIKLQSAVLHLGQVLSSMTAPLGRKTNTANPSAGEAEAQRVLALVRASPARSLFGIRTGFVDSDDTVKLKAIAVVSWQMIGEATQICLNDVVNAVVDDRGIPCEQILLVRDSIGRMVGDGLLVILPNCGDFWDGRLILPKLTFSWICGGQESKGDFDPAKLDSARLRRGGVRDGKDEAGKRGKVMSAKEVCDLVRQGGVVGLDDPTRILASRLCLHSLRCETPRTADDPVGSQIIVLTGKSGSGKTFIAQSVATACALPHTVFDVTTLSSEAYIGGKVDDIWKSLLASCKGDLKTVMKGSLAILDEADKLDLRSRREVCTSAVQAELLRPLQGAEFLVGGKRQSDSRPFLFDSRNVAFILAGCFPDLGEIIQRKAGVRSIGFASQAGDRSHPYVLDALREYYLDELCNRISCVVSLPDPTEHSLQMATANGIQKGFSDLLLRRGIVLILNDASVREIARYGLETNTFYRGCRQVVGVLAEELLWDSTPNAYIITKADVRRAISRLASGLAQPDDKPATGGTEPIPDGDADAQSEQAGG